jgi:hypothetical protein
MFNKQHQRMRATGPGSLSTTLYLLEHIECPRHRWSSSCLVQPASRMLEQPN